MFDGDDRALLVAQFIVVATQVLEVGGAEAATVGQAGRGEGAAESGQQAAELP